MVSSNSKSRDSEKKVKSMKAKKVSKKSPAPVAYKSEEFVQDSDEEENEKGEPTDEDSDEGSDSDESSSSAKQNKAESKANRKMPAPTGSSSSSENESAESDESSEDEDESEDAAAPAPIAIEPTKQTARKPTTNTVSFQAPPPYRPPPGFDLASLDGTLKASQMLKKSSLEGKQIWYFTAPASVPISSIKAMSLLDAKNGKTVLIHEGNDYGFMKDSAEDTTYTRIMVPSSDAGYKAASKSIDQVFHLQQIAQDPTTTNPGRATIPARKPVRQQPPGLKMRFHPIGFGADEPGTIGSSSSDEEMEDAPSTARRPILKAKSAAKSRGEPADSDVMTDGPALRSRPHPDIVTTSSDVTSKKGKKRKHSEGGEKKSKHSSSSVMSTIDHRELKRLKKKQTESQRKLADHLSVSIEDQENTKTPLPLRPKTPPMHLVSTTPIPPPRPLTFSQPSAANTGLHHSKYSSKKSKSTEEHRDSSATQSSSGHLSLKELTRATDPKLTAGERREKIKKPKHKDAKRQKGDSV